MPELSLSNTFSLKGILQCYARDYSLLFWGSFKEQNQQKYKPGILLLSRSLKDVYNTQLGKDGHATIFDLTWESVT